MPKKVKKEVWNDEYYVRAYKLACEGAKDREIAETVGVGEARFKRWLSEKPALQAAVDEGRRKREDADGYKTAFFDYVEGRLPAQAKGVWEKIRVWDEQGSSNFEGKLETLLEGRGDRFRQHLWVQAMAFSHFDPREAGRLVGVGPATIKKWKEEDPGFEDVIYVLEEAKRDFCEAALMRLVHTGDTAAVIFANKTLNRKRGYEVKSTITHEGLVQHRLEQEVTLEQILERLPPTTQAAILDVVRQVVGDKDRKPPAREVMSLEPPRTVTEVSHED